MVHRLSRGLSTGPVQWRTVAFVALVAIVVLCHAWLTSELADRMVEIDAAAAMPARIEVAYVRTLEPEAPKAVAPVAATSTRAEPPGRRVPRSVARPASAAEPPVVDQPVPERVADACRL